MFARLSGSMQYPGRLMKLSARRRKSGDPLSGQRSSVESFPSPTSTHVPPTEQLLSTSHDREFSLLHPCRPLGSIVKHSWPAARPPWHMHDGIDAVELMSVEKYRVTLLPDDP